MKLFIMRHGQSVGNTKQGFIAGRSDLGGLTDVGRVQIIRSAYELRTQEINTIYSSPVARAQETAHILARALNLNVKTVDWVTELDHGKFEGNYWWEVIHKIPPSWRKDREDYYTAYPGGGESVAMMATRLWEGLHAFIPSLTSDSKNILISHQAPLSAIHYLLQNGDPASFTKSQQDAFLTHIHSFRMTNGGYIEATYNNGNLKSLEEKKEFEPIQERKQNVLFYAQGVLSSTKNIKVRRQQTASRNTVYHLSNDKDYLLKVLHVEDPPAIGRQVKLYEYLHAHHIAAPLISWHDHSKTFYKTDVFIQDYIEGVSQDSCLRNHPDKMKPVLKTIFTYLKHIHNIPTSEVSNFWIPPVFEQFRTWKPFMIYNINFTLHHLTELSLSSDSQARIHQALSALKTYIRSGSYDLIPIHGDLAPDNIILNHAKKSCTFVRLIDFEWARLGDRLWDYAYYWGWLERLHESTATSWHELLKKNCTATELEKIEQYRVLFHAWTVRDMLEYKTDSLRLTRGERSKELLL